MKKNIFWAIFFLICFSLGLVHGLRPRGTTLSGLIPPKTISVLVTDEALFTKQIRAEIESKISVHFSVTVTRDWDSFIVKLVESPSVDLVIAPSYWMRSLQKQNLLSDISELSSDNLFPRVSADFIKDTQAGFVFLPLYWVSTALATPGTSTFPEFLSNKSWPQLQLLGDEDLILRRIQHWKQQGFLNLVQQKKLIAFSLDKINQPAVDLSGQETTNTSLVNKNNDTPFLSALLVWGAGVPKNSAHKSRLVKVLMQLTSSELQEQHLMQSPFNTCLKNVSDKVMPLHRRAEWVRDLKLNETILIEDKDVDALKKLRDTYKINIL